MKNINFKILTISLLNFFYSNAQTATAKEEFPFKSIKIDTLFQDKISIRAILIDEKKVWYAADKNRFGYYDLLAQNKFENTIQNDTLVLEFRSIAKTSKALFILSVGNPAVLYAIDKDGKNTQLVYQENDKKVFYDSMKFWNETDGIAIGDPILDVFSILLTHDAGHTWRKIPKKALPKTADGEAAFAASNTNIVIRGNRTWLVSGGKKARVWYSTNKGKSWRIYETPILQGKTMTGIFTADFYDTKNGIISGGNYENLAQNFANKAITTNGGKTWQLVSNNQNPGYTSCVQYVPNSNGKGVVAIGATGLYYSDDGGKTWKQFATDTTLYTIRFVTPTTAIAAGKDKMIRIEFK
ncbi:WD40/YVTN/BNR-like repeat-containing protein [Flavobacterium restrictum]|uniref:Oxidoreductase n=1 Tax=Flavobacterium restrictum TaxID=2594428 RepID=A0A553DXM0_9FLAO|nr:oxidoreductase [Flavobacterium restrictum]TRX37521.1 oxidoreductase [Flavobacterium restrictum]